MYTSRIFIAALTASSTASAFNFAEGANTGLQHGRHAFDGIKSWANNIFGRQKQCPAVWSEISTTLTAQFLADGQCTDAARAAIRAAFHDCFPGSCDGSLILANECADPKNAGLEQLCSNLGNLATQKQVGVADLIQFAAAHAIKTCPGGPTVPVKVGRKDSSTANDFSILPAHDAGGANLIQSFGMPFLKNTNL